MTKLQKPQILKIHKNPLETRYWLFLIYHLYITNTISYYKLKKKKKNRKRKKLTILKPNSETKITHLCSCSTISEASVVLRGDRTVRNDRSFGKRIHRGRHFIEFQHICVALVHIAEVKIAGRENCLPRQRERNRGA